MRILTAIALRAIRKQIAVGETAFLSNSSIRIVRLTSQWVLWRDAAGDTFTLADGSELEVKVQ